jgi:hypothetical protein
VVVGFNDVVVGARPSVQSSDLSLYGLVTLGFVLRTNNTVWCGPKWGTI